MPQYTIKDAEALQAAARDYVTACQMTMEAEKALRVFLPTISSETLLTAAIELNNAGEKIDSAIELLEKLSEQPVVEELSEPVENPVERPEGPTLVSQTFETVQKYPNLTRNELADKAGIRPEQVSTSLTHLRRKGLVEKTTKKGFPAIWRESKTSSSESDPETGSDPETEPNEITKVQKYIKHSWEKHGARDTMIWLVRNLYKKHQDMAVTHARKLIEFAGLEPDEIVIYAGIEEADKLSQAEEKDV